MADEDLLDDDTDDSGEADRYTIERAPTTRTRTLASRRRIEDLKEQRRMRELLDDDEYTLDY